MAAPIHHTLLAIVQAARSLAPFPKVAQAVLERASQPEVIPSALIDLIQTDPGLTAKVLKLCNSAYYGFQREVSSIREAGNMLGVDELVALVMTSCAGRFFRDYGAAEGNDQEQRWSDCVTRAVAAKLLASQTPGLNPDRAYTAGLLQNIGELVLDRYSRPAQAQINALIDRGADLLRAEREVLGIHHAELGARLCSRWGFPPVLVDTIRFHHAPDLATEDPLLASTLYLAETVTAATEAGDDPFDLIWEVNKAALELTGLTQSDLLMFDTLLAEELIRSEALLAV